MIDQYLTPILEEAERVAEYHDQIAQSADNPYHEYLRYAVLRRVDHEIKQRRVPRPDGRLPAESG